MPRGVKGSGEPKTAAPKAVLALLYFYAKSHDNSVRVGRIGTLECDFMLKDAFLNHPYAQVAFTIHESRFSDH